MNKIFITALGVIMMPSVCLGFSGNEKLRPVAEKPAKMQVNTCSNMDRVIKDNKAAKKKPDFYGIVLASASRPAGPPVLAKFRAGYSPEPETLGTLPQMSGCSGTYSSDRFCYMDYVTNSAGGITAVNWNRMDMETLVSETRSLDYALGVCMDMTYDVTSDKIYGISALADVLVEIDPLTGDSEIVAETLPFYTLSADAAGQLYAILLDTSNAEGVLYTVNKQTGTALKIGSTGVKMYTDPSGTMSYYQTAAFSSADGNLYWAVADKDGSSGIYRIDVSTGEAVYLAPFPDNQDFVALFEMPEALNPDAPGGVSDLVAKADPSGALSVEISFKAPSLTAGGAALESLSSVNIYRGKETEAAQVFDAPAPEASLVWTDSEAQDGINVYRIISVNEAGESQAVYVSVYCGEDLPGAPTDVSISINGKGEPVLSWKAPAKGVNGLDMKPEKLTYKVYRDLTGAGAVLIGENITGTAFTDETISLSTQSYPYYYVMAVSSAGEGLQSLPVGTYCGPAYPLPFTESFKDTTPSSAPWILQSLALGGAWELNYISTFPGSGPYDDDGMLVFIGFRSVEGAEARIATPQLTFENATNPELKFYFYYLDMADEDLLFNDYMVVEASVDGGEFMPLEGGKFVQHDANTRWTECTVPLKSLAGKKKVAIGFHGYSGGGFDLLVDNIRVIDAPTSGIAAPIVEEGEMRWYTLEGLPLDGAPTTSGIYIVRKGGKTQKVLIK